MSNIIKNRHELVFWVECLYNNYNGDPDIDNMPRQDLKTKHGFMTDSSLKRKVRDYVAAAFPEKDGFEIFIENGKNLNRKIAECCIEAQGGKKVVKSKNSMEASKIAVEKFWDVRTFGGVLTTGLNAGQVRGPVQFDMPISYDVVEPNVATITRLAYASGEHTELEAYDIDDAKLADDKKRTMGKKTFVPFALFECHVFISANLAKESGFSEEDLDVLLESILQMFSFQTSATKAGVSVVGPVVIFKHVGNNSNTNLEQKNREALMGCCAAQKLFRLINVVKKNEVEYPRSYKDYDATINLSKLPVGVEVGFKYEPFENIVWHHISENDEWFKEL